MLLLPFAFKKVKSGHILVVNQGGEYLFLNRGEFDSLLNADRKPLPDNLMKVFKSKQLIATDDKELALNLLAAKLRTRKSFIRDFTSLHMMVLTTRCNCVCDYCHASSSDAQAQNSDMAWPVAKAAVDVIFQSPSTDIKIEFQGGEPLLNWDVLQNTVLYAEELNKANAGRCSGFVVCTNLMNIDEDKLQFCKEHQIEISTSLDGPRSLHDLHRKARNGCSSYDLFMQKLEKTRSMLGPDSCNALLTITKDHLPRLRETIDEYRKHGFNNVFLRAINPYGYAVENKELVGYPIEEFITAYKDALEYIISLNKMGEVFVESYAALLLQRILTPYPTGFVDLQSPAGAGISGVIYDYNGDVYPADEGRMLARMGDRRFLMGNVLHDSYDALFNGKLIHELVRDSCVEVMPACATCVYQIYCGADPIRYYVECGDITGRRPESGFCKKNMAIFDYLFELLENADDKTIDIFWSWATRRGLKEIRLEDN
ncbi:His-Xaa-Ser system radical SAM maturase HxsB [uncultured Cloacibacillus sp.]|uniref:His-Xaa-Ser system radical SAM maturase HxsB n=1 Tax=uncultured Cloacibacillus sp. TaxID=889794 RepID=UPI0027D93750|nr:His-Xaa-Ser system radical SAM maturase HxsB [uncultured Cloacibacillus sp.]